MIGDDVKLEIIEIITIKYHLTEKLQVCFLRCEADTLRKKEKS